jgi:hypothetical protein
MRRSILSCWPVWVYRTFTHYLIYGPNFGKKILLNKKYVFDFIPLLSETFIIPRRIQRDIVINIYRSLCKWLIILVIFEWNLNFFESFSKNIQISNFIKIYQWVPSCSNADRRTDIRTDVMKLIVAFHNFVNASEDDGSQFEIYLLHCCPTKLHTTLAVNNWDSTKCVQAKDQDLTKEHKYWGLEIGLSLLPTVERKTKRVSGIQTNTQREPGASLHSKESEMKWERPTSLTAHKSSNCVGMMKKL